MLKRKLFIKYENESNESFENRINKYLNQDDLLYTEDNTAGHYCHLSDNGKTVIILFHHYVSDKSKKQIGF